ncbi:polyribonucleotide nucleotidyltransferase [Candidatus Endolissoclinum faulkneri L5]|uniref:Polyribonucleotide nucleotidyltransferase n=2 Tax=Candidatus Endolissoclinum faulkneri TaxID=1263979 RepID=V9TT17_9PROT|nr:polyribonucleotide nucleotidyltransferase [Candidatus Endolissoclinum faulkneri L5]
MFEVYRKEIEWGNRTFSFETGKIARQADGAVLARYGNTAVLCTVVINKTQRHDIDFFPLSVHYQEKTYAAGKVPGGFFKRESRPNEKETLTSRLIDRPIRPLFVNEFKNEVQVICTVLAHDLKNDPDIVAMLGTSAALCLSGAPFLGPIGAARVGYSDGQYILNPTIDTAKKSELDLVLAGTQEGLLMVESMAYELSEKVMLDAINFGHKSFQPMIDAIIELAEACAKDPMDLPETKLDIKAIRRKLEASGKAMMETAYDEPNKIKRQNKIIDAKKKAIESIDDLLEEEVANTLLKNIESDIVRSRILNTGKRIDERNTSTIRPIAAEIGLFPRLHGSALFTRGETQAMVITTLGSSHDEQIVDALEGEYREHFLLHYNFSAFSVNEVGRMGPPGRREVGHGKLAWRSLKPLLPSKEHFPYTLRVVSEITEANGSSSMATVCGASLSLMDAGVPLVRPVAGIAMGLIKKGEEFVVLSDILGDEDELGDMDLKVAGTNKGITALQMDIKITSITIEIIKIALEQAKNGRLDILNEMNKILPIAREHVSKTAPKMRSIKIPVNKIRDVIGSRGKVIREICETTGAKIDVEDDGNVKIVAVDKIALEAAHNWIYSLISEPEIGKVYDGKVVKTLDFGAFVNFFGSKDGLVHISQLTRGKRPETVSEVVKEGDKVKVKVIGFDDRGKVKLSMKIIDQDTGNDLADNIK